MIYYAGVLKVLEQLGIATPGGAKTPSAGASAGALASAAVCSGAGAEAFRRSISDLTARCYKTPAACAGSMDGALRATLASFLPSDAAQRCSAGALTVALTVYDEPGRPKGEEIRSFSDRGDLISTLAASSYIPMWSGARLFTGWRGRNVIDGGVTARQPCPAGPKVSYCVRISAASADGAAEPAGNSAGAGAAGLSEVIRQIQRALNGERTAAAAVKKPPLPALSAVAPADAARMERLRQRGVDIAPGLAAPNPFSAETWREVRASGVARSGRGGGRRGPSSGAVRPRVPHAPFVWPHLPVLTPSSLSRPSLPSLPLLPHKHALAHVHTQTHKKRQTALHAAVRPGHVRLHLWHGPGRRLSMGQGGRHRGGREEEGPRGGPAAAAARRGRWRRRRRRWFGRGVSGAV